jgi:glutathione synthase/RimK-type ligase-like ATP-grasp enzyme
MKIGIHHTIGTFSEYWIAYCEEKKIPFKIVNCYANDIIEQLADCDSLMWHFCQGDQRDMLFAKQLILSLELMGKKVFPDSYTSWHFDDKLGQKYLFEAVGAPLVPTYAFYSKIEALQWIQITSFPKVFKLRGGAASQNVKLVRNKKNAIKLVKKAFSRGFLEFDRFGYLKERLRLYREGKSGIFSVVKGFGRLFIPVMRQKREKGYIYFQDFIPNQKFDIRVVVIQNKAFAIKRMVRENDFRASGSGNLSYSVNNFPLKVIELSLQLANTIRSQCAAFDFIFDAKENPLVTEVSFGFVPKPYESCEGFWDSVLNLHKGKFNPFGWMVESILQA